MEALTAAAVAALTIYDMTKALDKAIEIRTCFCSKKPAAKAAITEGQVWGGMIGVSILTVSDSSAKGTREDISGPAVAEK